MCKTDSHAPRVSPSITPESFPTVEDAAFTKDVLNTFEEQPDLHDPELLPLESEAHEMDPADEDLLVLASKPLEQHEKFEPAVANRRYRTCRNEKAARARKPCAINPSPYPYAPKDD